MVSAKGKEKVIDAGGKGKRKWNGHGGGDDDKTGRKRKNPGALRFIEDSAYQDDDDDFSSDFSSDCSGYEDEIFEDENGSQVNINNDLGKASNIPHVKEEEMSEEEFDRIMEERYKPGTCYVTYAEDEKNSTDSIYVPSAKDPTIWKVKCMVGRERYSALCLMQKYADLTYLQKLQMQIISACALDHLKGFIIIEAERQNDIYEACKGLSTIYSSKVTAVPSNEISRLLSIRSKSSAISKDMWARVKSGKYKGDLAKVVAVNDERKKVTVQLIPRIDLKSMAEKFGGGIPTKRTAIPAQRLITPSELEEFRPLIQSRRDRDTNLMFEILDGMMLKDGYLYKKIAIDSLSFWGIVPTEDELLKFEPAKKDESTDVQWLSQLFGEKKKKEVKRIKPLPDKGGGKSEGSSSANPENNFELHDLVFIGRKDFGVVISTEKDDSVKVIKEGSEGPVVVTVKQSELKIASFDRKLFTVLDQHSNTLTVNDEVRVLDGPLKGRQGIIKKIYKGILFLYDESEQENNGYVCIKAQVCEKVNLSGDDPNEKDGDSVPSGFADLTSSPKSPLSPDKSLQERDNKRNFARDENGIFSVGQSLRIRVGPLKGYLCRVLAVRRSDVTVKLDSKHKIITVKSEHLSEVRGRNSGIAQGEDSGSVKPFDFLGGQDGSSDWMEGAALSTEENKWNAGGSTERSSWSAVPSSDVSLPKESGSGDANDDPKKEESSWQVKEPNQSSSWGAAAASTGWAKPVEPQVVSSSESLKDDSWGKAAEKWNSGDDASASKALWGQTGVSSGKQIGGDLDQPETSAWGSAGGKSNVDAVGWAVPATDKQDSQTKDWATGKGGDDVTENNQNDSWNKLSSVCADSGTSWPKQDSKSSWGKAEGTASWSKQDGGSSWGKKEDACQEASWGSPKTFDSGRGSGGRRGRGGRDNYGRGRSFDQDQSSSWSKGGQFGGSNDVGKAGSWSSNPSSGWGKSLSDEGSKGNGGWGKEGKENVSGKGEESSWNQGSNANKDGGGQGWGSSNPEGDSKPSSGWNVPKASNSCDTSGWGRSSSANEQAGDAGTGDNSWDKLQKPNENNKSSWNAAATSLDGNQSSGWSKESNCDSQKAPEENSGWNQSSAGNGKDGSSSAWDVAKKNDDSSTGWKNNDNSSTGWKSNEGSSAGWGQSNWSKKSGTSETGGNQDGTWSSKGNWNSGGGFNDRNNQDDGGRGGGWRGRGGRGDRGGFRGRGGSDNGGDFGGRGGRGRFGGRGSDRGGYGGRGGYDREGFRGRGGFRGRARGDWNNREDNSNQDRSSSWGRGSNNDGEGWKSSGNASSWKQGDGGNSWGSSWNQPKDNASEGGTWNQKGNDNNQSQGWNSSWNQSKGDGSSSVNAQAGGWGKANDSNKDAVQSDAGGGGGWGSVSAPPKEVSVGWGKPSANKETSSWNNNPTSNDGTPSVKAAESSWGAPPVNTNSSGSWNKPELTDGVSVGWGKPSANKETSSWNNNPTSNDGTPSVKAEESSWGAPPVNTNSSGSWNKPELTDGSASTKVEGPSDSWSKPATGTWGATPSTNSNSSGGWNKSENTDGAQTNASTKDEGPSDPWGKDATSTWGSGSGSGKGGW